MKQNAKLTAGIVAGLLVAGGATAAIAGNPFDDDQPITGEALEKASEAALEHVGEGTVTDTEVDDEDSYYEVEVTRADGSEVDVQLDEEFNVVGVEDEGEESAEDEDSSDEDAS